jgi:putative transposon-encoded protein
MREIKAVVGGKLSIKDDVEEIYEKRVTPYGNGAKIDAQKKYIGKRVFVIILKDGEV